MDRILKWNGTSFIAQNSGVTESLYGIWGTDANNVWAVGYPGTILKWSRASSRNGCRLFPEPLGR